MESLALNSTILTPCGFRPRVNGPRHGVRITPHRLWGRDDIAALREAPFVRVQGTEPDPDGSPGTDPLPDRATLETVVALALSGVPVTGHGLPDSVRDRLDPDLLEVLDTVTPDTAADPDERELASLALRRRAWQRAGYRPPTDTPPAVLVLLPAGEHPAYLEQDLAAQVTPGLSVRARPVADGEAAEQLVREEREQGAVYVTRMDPGLRYGPHHLVDLVHALSHSGARVAVSPRRFVRWEGAWLEDVSGGTEGPAEHGLPGGSLWYAVDGAVEPGARGEGYAVHGCNAVPISGVPVSGEPVSGVELAPLRMHAGTPRLLAWLDPDGPDPEARRREPGPGLRVGPSYFAAGSGGPERARSALTASES